MIITDESHKDPLIPKNRQNGESGQPPPPPYSPITENPYQNNPNRAQIIPVVTVRRQSPGGRFFRAFVVAALIWFLACALTQSIFELNHWPHRHWQRHLQGQWDVPLPEGQIDHCIGSTGWRRGDNSDRDTHFPHYATTSFPLPADSDLVFVVAQGALSSGRFEIVESTTLTSIEVDVTVRFYATNLLHAADVCLLKRDGNQRGVGIFTPKHWEKWFPRDQLQFEVIMHLPSSKGGSPLQIKGLETTLPHFSHKLGDLRDKVNFKSLSLTSTDMPIIVQSIYADNALVHTLNGPITGFFKTSTSLELLTANAPINVDVELESNSGHFTDLRMKTANSPIDATVALLSDSSSGGNFSVSAINANGRISINTPTSPINSTLQLQATTANSPVKVTLDPAYEGPFSVSSTPFSNVLLDTRKVDDPSGKGRTRTVVPNRDHKGSVDGRVWWGTDERKSESWVKVKTVNSDARLIL